MSKVALESLTKSYDQRSFVLKDISLEINEGEFIALVGPSGCGKSTLLRMIAGLEEITSGDLKIAGQRVNDTPPAERNIAMVFQDYALYPHMSVRENLAFGLRIRKLSQAKIDEQIRFAAQLLGLETLLDRKPAALSGGQRQRVAIGRAIVRKPAVFLFDEPLSNLDAQLRMQTRVELAALHRKLGATTVYVTHDQTEAMTLADRIVVLDRGRIQQVGAPLELYHRPANRFVASFIGSPGMNFIAGSLESNGVFKAPGLELKVPPTLANNNPRALILGIRPEGLRITPEKPDLRFTVKAVEPLGHETLIALDGPSGTSLLLRGAGAEGARIRAGDAVPVSFDRAALNWFQADDGGLRVDGPVDHPSI